MNERNSGYDRWPFFGRPLAHDTVHAPELIVRALLRQPSRPSAIVNIFTLCREHRIDMLLSTCLVAIHSKFMQNCIYMFLHFLIHRKSSKWIYMKLRIQKMLHNAAVHFGTATKNLYFKMLTS